MRKRRRIIKAVATIVIVAFIASIINSLIPRKIFEDLNERFIYQIRIEIFDESLQEYIFLQNEIDEDLREDNDVFNAIGEVISKIEGKPSINMFGFAPSKRMENDLNWPMFAIFSRRAKESNTDMVLSITHHSYMGGFEALYLYIGENSLAVKSEAFFTKYRISNGQKIKEEILQILKKN